MNIEAAFPSKYLKASDLLERPHTVIMDRVVQEEIGQGDMDLKPVLYFKKATKGLVLNVTNGRMIASAYGNETEDWSGLEIEIYPDRTPFKSQIVDCIRVRVPQQAKPARGAFAGALVSNARPSTTAPPPEPEYITDDPPPPTTDDPPF